MGGIGPRATIVLPANTQFSFEGVPLKFAQPVEAECAASNHAALQALVAKCGGVIATKEGKEAAIAEQSEIRSELRDYQKATNDQIKTIGLGLTSIVEEIKKLTPKAADKPAEKVETKTK